MPEIRLVKRYPHIKNEDVTSIFQEGYIKGFENGRKGAIPVEWIKNYIIPFQVHHDSLSEETKENDGAGWVIDVLETMLREWEKENETSETSN